MILEIQLEKIRPSFIPGDQSEWEARLTGGTVIWKGWMDSKDECTQLIGKI